MASLVRHPARPRAAEGLLETEVTYVDSFGNLRLAGRSDDLAAAFGSLDPRARHVRIGAKTCGKCRSSPSFGHVPEGEILLFVDSTGDLALAVNHGDLAARTGATTGTPVSFERR